MPCNCCQTIDNTFGEDEARRNLKDYQKRGPAGQTCEILKAIRNLGLRGASLLDIGGGIGAIHHELLEDTASEAMHVDSSAAYLDAAQAEASRRGHSARVKFMHADFVDIASEVPEADVVTLDRVVCCYPDFRRLLGAAAGHSRSALAMTYPRETWYMRIGLSLMNTLQALRRDPFRVFLHPVAEMDALLNRAGMRRVAMKRLFVWEMALYRRTSAT